MGPRRVGKSYWIRKNLPGAPLLDLLKGSARVHEGDLRPLAALRDEHKVRRAVVVSLESHPRRLSDGTEVLPWRLFLERLWSGDLGL